MSQEVRLYTIKLELQAQRGIVATKGCVRVLENEAYVLLTLAARGRAVCFCSRFSHNSQYFLYRPRPHNIRMCETPNAPQYAIDHVCM